MPAADTLLQVWERGRSGSEAERALTLLAIAVPDQPRNILAAFDLGLRDWHLLRLYVAWFGPHLPGTAECPWCAERLEVVFDAGVVGAPAPPAVQPYTAFDGRRFRLPNVGDLLAISDIDNGDIAARRLFERCCLDGSPPVEADAGVLFEQVDEGLAALARERGIELSLSCAVCGRESAHTLDPGVFLWSEVAERAAGLLDDVHRLARAYGWSERDILAMSAARRAAYLERIPA